MRRRGAWRGGVPRAWCLAAALLVSLAACKTTEDELTTTSIDAPVDLSAPPPDPVGFVDVAPTETYRLGLQHFNRGDYGLAERYLRATVEKKPENAEAWVALAASYDRNRRFDLADRAYKVAISLSGETVQILNNQGFSYMLRGDYRTAVAKFHRALRLDPGNATIINNLRILDAQERANRARP